MPLPALGAAFFSVKNPEKTGMQPIVDIYLTEFIGKITGMTCPEVNRIDQELMQMNLESLLAILPKWMRGAALGDALELRLRLGRKPLVCMSGGTRMLEGTVGEGDLSFVLNAASRYSPWNAASVKEGYLTAPGGHRIGVCGDCAGEGIRTVRSLCIRVARDLTGVATGLPTGENLLILGPPGAGKTTLLRDYIRNLPGPVAVVDERRELFPEGFRAGNADVLQGVAKEQGMDMVLRSMGPKTIAMDEVTSAGDCEALQRAAWCGVILVATAHAGSVADLNHRSIYRPLARSGLFRRAVVLDRDFLWHLEEVEP